MTNPTQEKQSWEYLLEHFQLYRQVATREGFAYEPVEFQAVLAALAQAAKLEERKLVLSEIGPDMDVRPEIKEWLVMPKEQSIGYNKANEELRQKTLKRISELAVPVEELEK